MLWFSIVRFWSWSDSLSVQDCKIETVSKKKKKKERIIIRKKRARWKKKKKNKAVVVFFKQSWAGSSSPLSSRSFTLGFDSFFRFFSFTSFLVLGLYLHHSHPPPPLWQRKKATSQTDDGSINKWSLNSFHLWINLVRTENMCLIYSLLSFFFFFWSEKKRNKRIIIGKSRNKSWSSLVYYLM